MVAVEVADIARVVDPVVTRSIEKELDEGREAFHGFGMEEKLVYEADGHDGDHLHGMESHQGQPEVPNVFVEEFSPTLPEGHRQIVMLRGMVVDMRRPKEPNLMAGAVVDIEGQIVRKEKENPRPPVIG